MRSASTRSGRPSAVKRRTLIDDPPGAPVLASDGLSLRGAEPKERACIEAPGNVTIGLGDAGRLCMEHRRAPDRPVGPALVGDGRGGGSACHRDREDRAGTHPRVARAELAPDLKLRSPGRPGLVVNRLTM